LATRGVPRERDELGADVRAEAGTEHRAERFRGAFEIRGGGTRAAPQPKNGRAAT
jgi:hypothetical protein